jgi:hypothetical protein
MISMNTAWSDPTVPENAPSQNVFPFSTEQLVPNPCHSERVFIVPVIPPERLRLTDGGCRRRLTQGARDR